MILFATVSVPMTLFKVDILIGGSRKEVTALNMQRYGFTSKEDAEPISRNECNTINWDKIAR